MAKQSQKYEGRLMADGYGNLRADQAEKYGEQTIGAFDMNGNALLDGNGNQIMVTVPIMRYGEDHGRSVIHDVKAGHYRFLKNGEKSHNEVHHQQFLDVVGTQDVDETQPGYAGSKKEPTKGAEHHWGPTEDDAHYDDTADRNTRLKFDDNHVAAKMMGHTAAYEGKVDSDDE